MDARHLATALTRRQSPRPTALAGSGLTLGVLLPGCGPAGTGAGTAAAAAPLEMPFVRIAPDNSGAVISKPLDAGRVGRERDQVPPRPRLPRGSRCRACESHLTTRSP